MLHLLIPSRCCSPPWVGQGLILRPKKQSPSPIMRTAFLLACIALVNSCGRPKDGNIIRRDGQPGYLRSEGTSKEQLHLATARARKEIDTFVAVLQNPKPSQKHFSVKKAFSVKNGNKTSHEHIWLLDVSFRDGQFHGKVDNDPVDVKGLKFGDDAVVDKNEASDWMIIEDGYLVGGYTIIAIRDALPQDERKDFDAHFPYKFRGH